MKKGSVITLVSSIALLISIPLTILGVGFLTPAQYDESYYGELPYLFSRLKKAKREKVIFVGNSALAFGVRKDVLEKELLTDVNLFGLYGAIGTKAMMDLSKVNIGKGDIVVLAPELTEQGCSLYYSAENLWMAIDGHYEILNYVAKEDKQKMVGTFTKFTSEKLKYAIKGEKPSVEGVYMQSSFNDYGGNEIGYMTYYRDYNHLVNGYDSNSMIDFNTDLFDEDFIDYINSYNKFIKKKQAKLYFGFVPMNRMAVTVDQEQIETFYSFLDEKLDCPILGKPDNYIFDFEWFYDNNMHLNTDGTFIYNKALVDDLKIVMENTSHTDIHIPEKPTIPVEPFEEGDNSDTALFEYEEYSTGYRLCGISEEGKNRKRITLPSTYNDQPVIAFTKDLFNNNKNISEIIIPTNIRAIEDRSFVGCSNLTRLILCQENPNRLKVGMSLLDGAPNCSIYVKENSLNAYQTHYDWTYYKDLIIKY